MRYMEGFFVHEVAPTPDHLVNWKVKAVEPIDDKAIWVHTQDAQGAAMAGQWVDVYNHRHGRFDQLTDANGDSAFYLWDDQPWQVYLTDYFHAGAEEYCGPETEIICGLPSTGGWRVTFQFSETTEPIETYMQLLSIDFSPKTLKVGDNLTITAQVKNESTSSLITQGPEPGYQYAWGESYKSTNGSNYNEVGGAVRLGVEFAGRDATMPDHPFRWGLGTPIAPGETRTVTGAIKMTAAGTFTLWGGVVREQRAWDVKQFGDTVITVSEVIPEPQPGDYIQTVCPPSSAFPTWLTVSHGTDYKVAQVVYYDNKPADDPASEGNIRIHAVVRGADGVAITQHWPTGSSTHYTRNGATTFDQSGDSTFDPAHAVGPYRVTCGGASVSGLGLPLSQHVEYLIVFERIGAAQDGDLAARVTSLEEAAVGFADTGANHTTQLQSLQEWREKIRAA